MLLQYCQYKFNIKIMKLKTQPNYRNDFDSRQSKQIKSSALHNKYNQRNRQASFIRNENIPQANDMLNEQKKRMKKEDPNRRQNDFKLQFHNAQKLKHFEELKSSNIDDLNIKIKKMINKLSEEVSPYNSLIGVNKGSKMRLKTDYTDISSACGNSQKDSKITLDYYCSKQKQQMVESSIVSSTDSYQDRKFDTNQNVDQIRKKYKDGLNKTKNLKHQKSMSGFPNNSIVQEGSIHNYDAQIIRFRQKLKQNNQKDRKQLLSRQLNSSLNPSQTNKKNIKNIHVQPKKCNLEQQLKKYQKRLNTYNSKKLIGLANEGQIQRIPLGDRTNSNNSYLKYSPFSSKKQDFTPQVKRQFTTQMKTRTNNQNTYNPHVEQFEQFQQPLTADFRQISDKNQLKILLKNLSTQITLDEAFRNSKKWFSKLNNSSKWEHLMSQIEQTNLNLDESSIEQIFTMKQQEQNPFYTPRQSQFSVRTMVEFFIKCEEHWFQNIVKKYNRQRLVQSGFKNSKIDIGNKGYLSIEDFVRFLNVQIDLQIRNRDMLIIFERLKSDENLTFEDLLQIICS